MLIKMMLDVQNSYIYKYVFQTQGVLWKIMPLTYNPRNYNRDRELNNVFA